MVRDVEPERVVAYIRVSPKENDARDRSYSIESQKSMIQDYCGRMDLTLEDDDVFIDDGYSGATLERPGVRAMRAKLKGCRRIGNYRGIVVAYLDRISRSTSDLDQLVQEFKKKHLALITIKEGLDTESLAGRLVVSIMIAVASWQRESTAERTSEMMLQAQRNGYLMGKDPPYGWSKARVDMGDGRHRWRLVSNNDEQRIVVLIFQMRGDGMKLHRIADRLTAMNLFTRNGKPWHKKQISRILNRDEHNLPEVVGPTIDDETSPRLVYTDRYNVLQAAD